MEPCAGRAPIEAAIREARKLTIVYGRYALVLEPQDGEPLTDVGKYAVVHESQDGGSTKVVLDIFNSNLPAAG